MRYIAPLTSTEKITLEEGYANGKKHHFRQRCFALLLSNQGYKIPQIATLIEVRQEAVRKWFNRWENMGIVGLMILPGRGVKAKLDSLAEIDVTKIKNELKNDPQSLKKVAQSLSKLLGFHVTIWMLKRFLKKKLGFTWRRFRKCLKSLQNEEEYQQKIEQLAQLLWLENEGYIKLYYGDASGFNLTPYIPYGWQEKGETIRITPQKSKRINVFGFLTRNNDFQAYTSEDSINSDLLIAFIDDFAQSITEKTVIVLDNAPIHRSGKFKEKIKEWQNKNLYIFYLPTYSPHLNIIETLWRKMKYEWLKPHHYKNWETLKQNINQILIEIGEKYLINFKELKQAII